MRRHKIGSIPTLLLLLVLGGCSVDEAGKPITGLVSVAVPRMHQPSGSSLSTGFAPIIELETVDLYPTLCYRIELSKSERAGGRVLIAIGDAVSTADACPDALGPAKSSVPIDSTASRYRVIFTLRDSVDIYDIRIEPDLISLIPVELHFTFPADTVWMR